MAEMLVDSTKLDACLDAEADAIRAKTGDSNDLTFDFANNKGFADAIAAIPSGGGGQQKILLASGTYTQAKNATVIVIPTSVPTNATEAYIVADESTIDTSSDYALAMYFVQDYQQIAKNVFQTNIQRGVGIYAKTGVKVYSDPRGGLNSNRIYGYGVYQVKAGTYNWYIWGYAT